MADTNRDRSNADLVSAVNEAEARFARLEERLVATP